MGKEFWYGNTAVITAVTNDYDLDHSHVYQDGVDYVFFTDGSSLPVDSEWRVEMLPKATRLDSSRLAKLPKLHPEQFDSLKKYRYIVWIDGDMGIISGSFVGDIMSYMHNGLVLSPHHDDRHCAYNEAYIGIDGKYKSEPMREQIDHYRNVGFPEDYGLYAAGIMARDTHNSQVRELGMTWLLQNILYSIQDQVSLPYSLWRTGFEPDILPKSLWGFNWVSISIHKGELKK